MNVDKKYKLNKAITSKEYIKPPKQKGKKVECKNCLNFKFGYYCDKLNKTGISSKN